MADDEPRFGGSPGPSTDKHNEPVIDPTRNVLDLVAAAIQRQDDLRAAEVEARKAEGEAIRSEIRAMCKIIHARLESHDREFQLVESRRVEQKVDTKVAVDAALNAAKEAVREQTAASEKSITKSETSASEQSRQQNATFTAALKGLSDIVADVKDRVVKMESRVVGAREGLTDRQANTTLNANIWAVIIAAIVLVVGLYATFHK